MGLSVTVLGSSGGYAGPGRACSGYLLQHEGGKLLLDIGPGVVSNMLKYIQADELDFLAVSHLHYDHYVDIYGLCTARRFWETRLPPLPLLAPAKAKKTIVSPLSGQSRDIFLECLEFIREPGENPLDVAGFEISAVPAKHYTDAFMFKVQAQGGVVCYTGDTGYSDSIVHLADGCDVLICEATFTTEVPYKIPGHLYASEAGTIASKAGVGRLILTHVWPTLDEKRALEDAGSNHDGPIDLASEGLTLEI